MVISGRAESKLEAMFSGEQLDEARRSLPEAFPGQADYGYENLVLAVLRLSEGDLARLKYFADRARSHPVDVVELVGYRPWLIAFGEWPERRTQLLDGGPVRAPDAGILRQPEDADLWEKTGLVCLELCVVCGELVSRDPLGNPKIVLTDLGSGAEKLVTAHRRCMDEGQALALSQDYGWREGW